MEENTMVDKEILLRAIQLWLKQKEQQQPKSNSGGDV